MALDPAWLQYPSAYIIHYMDDILLAHLDRAVLQDLLQDTVTRLQDRGLKVAPEKNTSDPSL